MICNCFNLFSHFPFRTLKLIYYNLNQHTHTLARNMQDLVAFIIFL